MNIRYHHPKASAATKQQQVLVQEKKVSSAVLLVQKLRLLEFFEVFLLFESSFFLRKSLFSKESLVGLVSLGLLKIYWTDLMTTEVSESETCVKKFGYKFAKGFF
eukprot:TRINITY_DN13314_c0_g1_i1.p1 TRINITY_DN13314_c0_g1~~TRINITY_DN13314_c0_g1_i1.p1  ORF type:complete len:105 (+),score=14.21 TRINITY_DN13314_c0_g1_i1:113-427(+)